MKKITYFIGLLLFLISAVRANIKFDVNANAHFGAEKDNIKGVTQTDDNNSFSLEGNMIKLDVKHSVSNSSPKLINLKVDTYKKVGENFILWDTSEVTTERGHSANLNLNKGRDNVNVVIAPTDI